MAASERDRTRHRHRSPDARGHLVAANREARLRIDYTVRGSRSCPAGCIRRGASRLMRMQRCKGMTGSRVEGRGRGEESARQITRWRGRRAEKVYLKESLSYRAMFRATLRAALPLFYNSPRGSPVIPPLIADITDRRANLTHLFAGW